MTRPVKFVALLLALVAPGQVLATPEGKSPAEAEARKTERFGAPVAEGPALPLAKVLEAPEQFSGKQVVVEGLVRRACTRKGCWMELSAPDGKGPGCRVTFQNYGFFVPLDSAGASARLEGVVQVKAVPADQVAHLESEGASFASKEADGSAREVRIVATGVELTR